MLTKLCISVVLNGIYSDGPHEPDLCTSTIERKQYLFQRPYVKKCSLCVLPLLNRSFHVFPNFLQGTVSEKPSTQLESKVGGGGGGDELAPHQTNVSTFWINIFALFGRITFKLGKLLMDIRLLLFIKI